MKNRLERACILLLTVLIMILQVATDLQAEEMVSPQQTENGVEKNNNSLITSNSVSAGELNGEKKDGASVVSAGEINQAMLTEDEMHITQSEEKSDGEINANPGNAFQIFYLTSQQDLLNMLQAMDEKIAETGEQAYVWGIVTNDFTVTSDITISNGCVRLSTQNNARLYMDGSFYVSSYLSFSNVSIVYQGTKYLAYALSEETEGSCISVEGATKLYGLVQEENGTPIPGTYQAEGILCGMGGNSRINFNAGSLGCAKHGITVKGGRAGYIKSGTIKYCEIGYELIAEPSMGQNAEMSAFGIKGGLITDCNIACRIENVLEITVNLEGTIKDSIVGVEAKNTIINCSSTISSCTTGIQLDNSGDTSKFDFCGRIDNCTIGLDNDFNHCNFKGALIKNSKTAIVNKGALNLLDCTVLNNENGILNLGVVNQNGGEISGCKNYLIFQHGSFNLSGSPSISDNGPIKLCGLNTVNISDGLNGSNINADIMIVGTAEENSEENDLSTEYYKRVGRVLITTPSKEIADSIEAHFYMIKGDTPSLNAAGADQEGFNGITGSAEVRCGSRYLLSGFSEANLYYSAKYNLEFVRPDISIEGLSSTVFAEGQESEEYKSSGYFGESTAFNSDATGKVEVKFYYTNEEGKKVSTNFIEQIGWTEDDDWQKNDTAEIYRDSFSIILNQNKKIYAAWGLGDAFKVQYEPNGASVMIDQKGQKAEAECLIGQMDENKDFTIMDNPYQKNNAKFVGWYPYNDKGEQSRVSNKDAIVTYKNDLILPGEVKDGYDFLNAAISDGFLNFYEDGSASIRLFAVWDSEPDLKADNIYITQNEIENLSEDIISAYAKAQCVDREDNFLGIENSVKLKDENNLEQIKKELSMLGETGATSVRFETEDSLGQKAYKTVMIYVTKTEELDVRSFVRFIDKENYEKTDEEDGALMNDSVWYLDLKETITNAFQGLDEEQYQMSFSFGLDDINESNNYISQNGLGNYQAESEEDDNLSGWISQMNDRGCIDTEGYIYNSDEKTYTIEFDANIPDGCSSEVYGSMERQSIKSNDMLSKNKFQLSGYTFQGWTTHADGSGKKYADEEIMRSIHVSYGSTLKLYANWEPNLCLVSFEGNGAEGYVPDQKMRYDKEYSLNKQAYTPRKYTISLDANGGSIDGEYLYILDAHFAGWGYGPNDSPVLRDQEKVKNLSANDHLTLYAIWYTESITLPKATRLGYEFLGYNTKADGSGIYVGKDSATITPEIGDACLYAIWKPLEFSIEYAANIPAGADQSSEISKIRVDYVYGKNCLTPVCSYQCDGYDFIGWNSLADGSGIMLQEGQPIGDEQFGQIENGTLYAVWTPHRYLVTFQSNLPEGVNLVSNLPEDMVCEFGTEYEISDQLPQTDQLGYSFQGWNTLADGSGAYYGAEGSFLNMTTENNGKVILYAIWDITE